MHLYRAKPGDVALAIPQVRQSLRKIMANYAGPWTVALNAGYFDDAAAYGIIANNGQIVWNLAQGRPAFVIYRSGTAAIVERVGDPALIPATIRVCLEVGPVLVREGRATNLAAEIEAGRFTGIRPGDRTARTVIGILPEGDVVAGVIPSATLAEAQSVLLSLGVRSAIYNDGGGSSVLLEERGGYDPRLLFGADDRRLPAGLVLARCEPVQAASSPPAPAPQPARPVRLMIDPGHTGVSDPGVTSGPLSEADLVLDISLHLRDLLAVVPGLEVRLTRDAPRDLAPAPWKQANDLKVRTDMANAWPADYYLSVHINGHHTETAHGYESFIHEKASAEAERVGKIIHRHLVPFFRADRGLKRANFHVLRETRMPAVLIELGFLSNPRDRADLADPAFRRKLAGALAAALLQAFDLQPAAVEPDPVPAGAMGSRGPAVVAVQRLLNRRFDAGLTEDGIWGPRTDEAYRKAIAAPERKGG